MPDIFLLASWIGGVAFALSGFLVGVRKNLDILGIFILSFLAASGGGIIRDVLIGRTPLALTDISAFLLVLVTFLLGVVLHHAKNINIEKRKFFVLSDSIGLVAFSLTGALVGVDAGLNAFGVVVLSFITATGGGILRDLLVNEVPVILESDFYGSVAVLVGLIVFGLHALGLGGDVYILLVFIAALVLRLIAWRYAWRLPKLKI